MKLVILLRDDKIILNGARQKIITDSSVTLNWNKTDLYRMIQKRLAVNHTSLEELFDQTIDVCNYNREVETIRFWDFLVDYTFYRPRDLVAFLNACKAEYGDKCHISNSDLDKVILNYSNTYFYPYLLDELNVYFQHNDIDKTKSNIDSLFYKLCDAPVDDSGTKYWNTMKGFFYIDFKENAKKLFSEEFHIDERVEELFEYLLKMGCIGQLKRIGAAPGKGECLRWAFAYEGEAVGCSENARYILHKALRYRIMKEYYIPSVAELGKVRGRECNGIEILFQIMGSVKKEESYDELDAYGDSWGDSWR